GAPHETVRRRIGELIERQVCAKMDGGVIVRPEALSAPPLSSVLQAAVHHLPALFAALSQLGVLEIWDSMRADGGQGSNGAG
ncbi:MAG: ArsR family transcriptional regulator, partial [Phenylobacterium sp.]